MFDSDDSENSSGILQNGLDNVADRVEFQYNRIGERIWKRDQNGTVHVYEFDNLGRLLHDRVTTLGTGVDGAVRRISTIYNIVGQMEKISKTSTKYVFIFGRFLPIGISSCNADFSGHVRISAR
jgi:hypothetical protein